LAGSGRIEVYRRRRQMHEQQAQLSPQPCLTLLQVLIL
jgi:hypothetical protein